MPRYHLSTNQEYPSDLLHGFHSDKQNKRNESKIMKPEKYDFAVTEGKMLTSCVNPT